MDDFSVIDLFLQASLIVQVGDDLIISGFNYFMDSYF